MPVTSTDSFYFYNTDGFTIHFTYPFYVDSGDSIQVSAVIPYPGGALIQYDLGTDYTISGAQDTSGSYPNGLVVNFLSAPASGFLLLARKTARTQLTEYIDNNPFTAESLNHALDKLTVMVQDFTAQYLGVAQGPPTTNVTTYFIGQWFKNILPLNSGDPFGWVCTNGGTPGTWKGFGALM